MGAPPARPDLRWNSLLRVGLLVRLVVLVLGSVVMQGAALASPTLHSEALSSAYHSCDSPSASTTPGANLPVYAPRSDPGNAGSSKSSTLLIAVRRAPKGGAGLRGRLADETGSFSPFAGRGAASRLTNSQAGDLAGWAGYKPVGRQLRGQGSFAAVGTTSFKTSIHIREASGRWRGLQKPLEASEHG